MDPTPRITASSQPPRLQLQGEWTAAQLAKSGVLTSLALELKKSTASDTLWDLQAVETLDHIGAQVLWNHWGQAWPAQVEATDAQRAVLAQVEKYTTRPPKLPRRGLWEYYLAFGNGLLMAGAHARGLVRTLGQLVLDIAQLIRHPNRAPWRDFSSHLYNIGLTAMPITALVGFLIGVVLAYLLAQQLIQFGATSYIVNILGVSLIRELGPMLAAILVAGRSGSAITAQIGVMRMNEEIDAMRVLGISRSFRLVMPRTLALAIVMPLISAWTTLAALFGGILTTDISMGITPSYFVSALPDAVSVNNLILATSKSMVFGVFIALISCYCGMRVKPNTQSLGHGTTTSVVASITSVILIDALFAILFKGVRA